MQRERSRSRSRGRDPAPASEEQSADSAPWWQKFKPAKAEDDDAAGQFGYGDNPWMQRAKPSNPWEAKQPEEPKAFGLAPIQPSSGPDSTDKWGYGSRPAVIPAFRPPPPPPGMPMSRPPGMFNGMPPQPMQQRQPGLIPPPPPPERPPSSSLLLENVPGDVNSLSKLFESFKPYGEIVTIHPNPAGLRAVIEFKERSSLDTVLALPQPPAGYAGVRFSLSSAPLPANRPRRENPVAEPLKGNLVLESEALRKARERREAKDEILSKKKTILIELTSQCKKMLVKISDKNSSEEMKLKARAVLSKLKEQIAELSKGIEDQERKQAEVMQKRMYERQVLMEKQSRQMSEIRQQEMTLDLRPKSVRLMELPTELSQSTVLAEYIRAMGIKDFTEVIWLDIRESAILRFANHSAAETLFKHELAFKAEWVSNEEADLLATTNEVEPLESTDEDVKVDEGNNQEEAAEE